MFSTIAIIGLFGLIIRCGIVIIKANMRKKIIYTSNKKQAA
jgi:hypothetical protein